MMSIQLFEQEPSRHTQLNPHSSKRAKNTKTEEKTHWAWRAFVSILALSSVPTTRAFSGGDVVVATDENITLTRSFGLLYPDSQAVALWRRDLGSPTGLEGLSYNETSTNAFTLCDGPNYCDKMSGSILADGNIFTVWGMSPPIPFNFATCMASIRDRWGNEVKAPYEEFAELSICNEIRTLSASDGVLIASINTRSELHLKKTSFDGNTEYFSDILFTASGGKQIFDILITDLEAEKALISFNYKNSTTGSILGYEVHKENGTLVNGVERDFSPNSCGDLTQYSIAAKGNMVCVAAKCGAEIVSRLFQNWAPTANNFNLTSDGYNPTTTGTDVGFPIGYRKTSGDPDDSAGVFYVLIDFLGNITISETSLASNTLIFQGHPHFSSQGNKVLGVWESEKAGGPREIVARVIDLDAELATEFPTSSPSLSPTTSPTSSGTAASPGSTSTASQMPSTTTAVGSTPSPTTVNTPTTEVIPINSSTPSETDNTGIIIAIVAAVSAVALAIFGAIFFILRRRKKVATTLPKALESATQSHHSQTYDVVPSQKESQKQSNGAHGRTSQYDKVSGVSPMQPGAGTPVYNNNGLKAPPLPPTYDSVDDAMRNQQQRASGLPAVASGSQYDKVDAVKPQTPLPQGEYQELRKADVNTPTKNLPANASRQYDDASSALSPPTTSGVNYTILPPQQSNHYESPIDKLD